MVKLVNRSHPTGSVPPLRQLTVRPTRPPEVLRAAEVHVWTIWRPRAEFLRACQAVLSGDERDLVDRFVLERDKRMAILSRGARRLLLASYLTARPGAVRFEETPHGKPSVSSHGSRLHFSTSHSGELLVFAIAKDRQVGIDVEQLRPRKGASAVADHFLSSREQAGLAALPAKTRTAAFYRCWTQKEAFVKLLGEGLRCPLDRFDVQVDPKQPPALVGFGTRGAPARHARNCVMASVEVPDGYVGTVGVSGSSAVVLQFAID